MESTKYLFVITSLTVYLVDLSAAECCRCCSIWEPHICPREYCSDGSKCDPWCGHDCNFLGCGCSSCRGSGRTDGRSAKDDNGFVQIDTNGDGELDVSECETYLRNGMMGNSTDKIDSLKGLFTLYDADNNGKLSYEEANSPSAFGNVRL